MHLVCFVMFDKTHGQDGFIESNNLIHVFADGILSYNLDRTLRNIMGHGTVSN